MAKANSCRRSSGPVQPLTLTLHRSSSLSGSLGASLSSDLSSSSSSSSSSFDSSMSSNFSSSQSGGNFLNRCTSPTRVNLNGFAPLSPSVRITIDRSRSHGRLMTASSRDHIVRKQSNNPLVNMPKRTCLCSPTTHPGSFRCSMHKNCNTGHSISYSSNRLNARRSAMANSLVRIGTVEGDLVKRALAQLIRPSSHSLRRRTDFRPKPSRLSVMSKADDDISISKPQFEV